ncbi:MAG: 2-oxo acid dehydrogenase subunit E2 [Sphaerochaetaceae bacterium]
MAVKQIKVPDIGGFSNVPIIEIYVAEGDTVQSGESLVALESEKAVTDIPSPFTGTIKTLNVKTADTVSKDSLLASIEVEETEKETAGKTNERTDTDGERSKEEQKVTHEMKKDVPSFQDSKEPSQNRSLSHATPSVRQYSRELGVDLSQVDPTGPHNRILREDVQNHVKSMIDSPRSAQGAPLEDFSVYGTIEKVQLSRIQKISGPHLQRSWQTIPHVTQFDQADVTELEKFRKEMKKEYDQLPLSILPFVVLAVVTALKKFPRFNASYDEHDNEIIHKFYYNIGIAVDTEEGLVVPVIKEADKKSVTQIAQQIVELSGKARERKLKTEDLSGSTFSISSLGGIGGTGFTPIINPPEVAILGISRMSIQPVADGERFVPRNILPFSLSYDHRVIDGVQGVRFTTYLASLLSDIRKVIM